MTSTLYVDNLEPNLGSRVMAAGHVVQVVSANLTSAAAISTTTETDTGLQCSITPTSASSKILILAQINVSSGSPSFGELNLTRGNTAIYFGDAAASKASASAMFYTYIASNAGVILSYPINYMDSPATTSATTYKIRASAVSSGSVYINQSYRDYAGTDYDHRVPSSITLMEIAQ